MIKKRLEKWVETGSRSRILVYACVLGLIGLVFMVWSLFDQGWIPVMMAMSVGQVIGTLSLALFILVIVIDLQRATFRPSIPPEPPKPEDD
jgi:ABC-type sulfate transport system permease subunit